MGLNIINLPVSYLVIQMFFVFKWFSPPETNRQPSPNSDIFILIMTIADATIRLILNIEWQISVKISHSHQSEITNTNALISPEPHIHSMQLPKHIW